MSNIIIIGLKSAGKTTIGKILAKKLKKKFFDTDKLIEKLYLKNTHIKKTFQKIYLDHGKTYFRDLEKKSILALKEQKDSIISIGGSTLIDRSIISFLSKMGKFIYLEISYQTLIERNLLIRPVFLDPKKPLSYLQSYYNKRVKIFDTLEKLLIKADKLTNKEILKEIENVLQ